MNTTAICTLLMELWCEQHNLTLKGVNEIGTDLYGDVHDDHSCNSGSACAGAARMDGGAC